MEKVLPIEIGRTFILWYNKHVGRYFSQKAFSIIEFLIVFAIISIMGAVAVLNIAPGRDRAEVNRITDQVIATLNLARSRTVSSKDLSSWGVRLSATQYEIFKGSLYATGPSNESFVFDSSRAEIQNIALNGGGSDVTFLRPNGDTATHGTFIVASKTSSFSNSVRVDPQGTTSKNTSAPSSPLNPNADTRHIHYTLGWSIQNAVTLTLTFQDLPNPDTVVNVGMGPYFNSDDTVFDWEGTTSVGGENQKLRIHTHSLTGSDTLLSINRDRRFNTKAVIIQIDSKEITRYAANGTVTLGPFGETMQTQ